MPLTLTLGTVQFQSFEIPENFGNLGGKQSSAVHEFPGGLRTIHKLGFFPSPLKWSGYLTGPETMDRLAVLKRLAATAQTVTLRYGPLSWSGSVLEFDAQARHQFLVPYSIHFEPIADLSGIGTVASSAGTAQEQVAEKQTGLTDAADSGSAKPTRAVSSTLPSSLELEERFSKIDAKLAAQPGLTP